MLNSGKFSLLTPLLGVSSGFIDVPSSVSSTIISSNGSSQTGERLNGQPPNPSGPPGNPFWGYHHGSGDAGGGRTFYFYDHYAFWVDYNHNVDIVMDVAC